MHSIDAGHRANGWSGCGYNFVVMLDGTAWEGRGWGLVGAHCEGHNRSGWGVQIHVGGGQEPTPAALATTRGLYEQACERAGRRLTMLGHSDGYATLCPGELLYDWVHAGMLLAATTTASISPIEKEPDMIIVNVPGVADYLVAGSRRVRIPDQATLDAWLKITGQTRATIPRLSGDDLQLLPDVAAPVATMVDVAALAAALAPHLAGVVDPADVAHRVLVGLGAALPHA